MMIRLEWELMALCGRNRDGSHATQNARRRILGLCARQLEERGYRRLKPGDLKGRHVRALVERWTAEGLSAGTIKNRMAHVRWWAEKVGKTGMVETSNAVYGIERRKLAGGDKSRTVSAGELGRIADERVRLSLRLQAAFGLRREEAIKFSPSYADRGEKLVLKASWTKGGRPRAIPVRTAAQRDLLAEVRRLVGDGCLIHPERNYARQLAVYEKSTSRAGLHRLHGLRHHYAQSRYRELTGRLAPTAGGPTRRSLSRLERRIDDEARRVISRELGHERRAIVAVYCG